MRRSKIKAEKQRKQAIQREWYRIQGSRLSVPSYGEQRELSNWSTDTAGYICEWGNWTEITGSFVNVTECDLCDSALTLWTDIGRTDRCSHQIVVPGFIFCSEVRCVVWNRQQESGSCVTWEWNSRRQFDVISVNCLPASEGELTLTASRTTTQIATGLSITFTSIPILNNKERRLFGFLTHSLNWEIDWGSSLGEMRRNYRTNEFSQRGLLEKRRFKVSQGLSEEVGERNREDWISIN